MEAEQESESSFADRLKAAMGETSRDALAKALDISVQAIAQVLKGTTRALTAENTVKAARFLGVDAYWLATGKGSPELVDVDSEEREFLAALRQIRRINPETYSALMRKINEIADGLSATDALLRANHGVTGYVTSSRAEEMLPAPAVQDGPAPRHDQLVGGISGFGDLVENDKRAVRRR